MEWISPGHADHSAWDVFHESALSKAVTNHLWLFVLNAKGVFAATRVVAHGQSRRFRVAQRRCTKHPSLVIGMLMG